MDDVKSLMPVYRSIKVVANVAPGRTQICRADNGKLICTHHGASNGRPYYTVIDGNANSDELAAVISELCQEWLDMKYRSTTREYSFEN